MNKLRVCSFCGAENVLPHKKYARRCVACGERYIKYHAYKLRLQKTDSAKTLDSLDAIVDEYRTLKRRGFWAPKEVK